MVPFLKRKNTAEMPYFLFAKKGEKCYDEYV